MAKTPTNPPRLTDRATLTIENGVAALAAKGVVIVGGGRRQFGLTLAAALPPRLGKISHVVSLKKEGAACDKASDPGTSRRGKPDALVHCWRFVKNPALLLNDGIARCVFDVSLPRLMLLTRAHCRP